MNYVFTLRYTWLVGTGVDWLEENKNNTGGEKITQ